MSPSTRVGTAVARLPADARARLRPAAHPARVDAQLATLTDEAFSRPGWLFERKLDGVRLLAHRRGDEVRLHSRRHEDRTRAFPELVDALRTAAPDDVVLDGEVVAFDGPVTSFARLQGRMGLDDPRRAVATGIAVYLYLFDLLHLDGLDTRPMGLRDRKRLLRAVVDYGEGIRFTPHRDESGEAHLADACARGWEGLIAKKAAAAYRPGRTRSWLKLKCSRGQELVIGGYTEPRGSRHGFGSLLLGHHEGGHLRYAGKVGTGFDQRTLTALSRRLADLRRPTSPFADPPRGRDIHWVEPRLVAQVAFTEWTRDGRLRHPRFQGLRDDKDPREVVREEP